MKHRVVAVAYLVSCVLALPAIFIDLLFVLDVVNPMSRIFQSSFQVRNESSADVRVWLAGGPGALSLLPLSTTLRRGGFLIRAGGTETFTYDWDDINFSVIIVEAPGGGYLALPVDTDDPKPECCRKNQRDLYVIPDLRDLRAATTEEREVLARGGRSIWLLIAPSMAMPVVAIYLHRVRRRLRRQGERGDSHAA